MWGDSQGGPVKGISDNDRNGNWSQSLSLGGGTPSLLPTPSGDLTPWRIY